MPRPHTAMRKIRDVLRLRFGEKLSVRQIAISSGLPRATVSDYVQRAVAAGVSWPLSPDIDDDALEAALFSSASPKPVTRPMPDWRKVHLELRRPHVTLMLLWHEYKETFPDGYAYSQFCEHYRVWRRHLDVVMRQHHKAGEKLFVDFPGRRIPIYDARSGELSFEAELFVAVLGASSYLFAEAFASQAIAVEAALQWSAWNGRTDESERVFSFANVISTVDGGTHVEGLKAALTSALNRFAYDSGKLKQDKKEAFHPKDIWEGLTAAVSVKVTDPQFEGQTKSRLNNSEVKGAVQTFVYGALGTWLRDGRFKKDAEAILARCLEARGSRLARGRADSKRKRGVFDDSPLPGKLQDCFDSTPVEEREIFIVEGDSALGTAGDARDKRFQAVLPVRGKILNVLGAKNERIWANNEVEAILVAMGGRKEAVGKRVVASLAPGERRYGKIVILTDADTDGAHICNLLLAMFHELFPTLVGEGRIFVARPPLFKIDLDAKGERFVYAYDEHERSALVKKHRRRGDDVSRFKGLGEMPWQHLQSTCFDPATRKLQQVTVEDVGEVSATLTLIMGNGPAAAGKRRSWLADVGLAVPS